ncbi:MAG: hypothetical protein ACRYGG_02120 [Janthinobacterium lividum]
MLDDPKIGRLSDAEFRTWVELLMVATKADANGNTRTTESDLDWTLRRNASVTLHALLKSEIVTLNDESEIVINAWEDRQKKGDSSAGRVKKFREKQRLSNTNANETLQKREANALEESREEEIRKEKPTTKAQRVPRFDAQAHLESMGVEPAIARDWLSLRKEKKLAPTETAFGGVLSEAGKAGISMNEALRICCTRGWGGFEFAWLANRGNAQAPPSGAGGKKFDPVEYVNRKRPDGEKNERNLIVDMQP